MCVHLIYKKTIYKKGRKRKKEGRGFSKYIEKHLFRCKSESGADVYFAYGVCRCFIIKNN